VIKARSANKFVLLSYTGQAIPNCILLRAANAEPLSTLLPSRLQCPLLHNLIGLLIRPKLEIVRAIPRLADLPWHPRDSQAIENINMVLESLCFVHARSAKLLECHELPRFQRMLQSDGALGAELFDAAVRVDVDEIEGVAGPVLRDVGVGEFIASAWCS
jgi:hypothetical protein